VTPKETTMTDHSHEISETFFSSPILNSPYDAAHHSAGAGKMVESGFGGAS
jgi:hypothetical protein